MLLNFQFFFLAILFLHLFQNYCLQWYQVSKFRQLTLFSPVVLDRITILYYNMYNTGTKDQSITVTYQINVNYENTING